MAGSAARFALASALFHADLHPACGAERNRAQQPGFVVHLVLPGFGCRNAAPGTRPAFCWRTDWPGGYPAHLGTQPGLSPAHPLPDPGRRLDGKYSELAACPPGFFAAGQGTLQDISRQAPAGIGENFSVCPNTVEGLAAGLGGALQAGGQWAYSLEVPGTLCLSRCHQQPPGSFVPTVGARISREHRWFRNNARASRGNTRTKIVLPGLWTASNFPAYHSTYGTLPTMSCFAFPSLLFHWRLA